MLKSLVNELNSIAKFCNLKIPNHTYQIMPWGDNTSTTLCFNKQHVGAFVLEPVCAGSLKQYVVTEPKHNVPEDFRGLVGVHRAIISYSAASKITSPDSFEKVLAPLINLGIQDLMNQFGDLSRYELSIVYPGYEHLVFRDTENAVGFEIRIWANKVK